MEQIRKNKNKIMEVAEHATGRNYNIIAYIMEIRVKVLYNEVLIYLFNSIHTNTMFSIDGKKTCQPKHNNVYPLLHNKTIL